MLCCHYNEHLLIVITMDVQIQQRLKYLYFCCSYFSVFNVFKGVLKSHILIQKCIVRSYEKLCKCAVFWTPVCHILLPVNNWWNTYFKLMLNKMKPWTIGKFNRIRLRQQMFELYNISINTYFRKLLSFPFWLTKFWEFDSDK